MSGKKQKKIWHIVASFKEYYGPASDTRMCKRLFSFDIEARTLPDAFMVFNKRYRLDELVEISITEVEHDEGEEKRTGAGVS